MKFNITEKKLERWAKQEEGCYIAAGISPSEKTVKSALHQSLEPAKPATQTRVLLVSAKTSNCEK